MNIMDIISTLSCGVFYAKDSILYFADKHSKYRTTKITEAEFELLKYMSFDIVREEKKFKTSNFVFLFVSLFLMITIYFIGNASVLYSKGLPLEEYFKIKVLNQTIAKEDFDDTRYFLINTIKRDYPDITINETAVSVIQADKNHNEYGGGYFSDIFNGNIIILYDNLIDYQAHEFIHHLSNTGLYIGWQNRFTNKARAINEGMTEYIKIKYLPETRVAYQEKYYIDALVSIFGEELLIRSYFENSHHELSKLFETYSNNFDLIKIMDNDHIKNQNSSEIREYIIQMFLNYLEKNQKTILDFDSYVNDFITSITNGQEQSQYEKEQIKKRIIKAILVINESYIEEKTILAKN